MKVLENGWISDEFEMARDGWVYRDAIVLPPEQYEAMTPEDIEAEKAARFERWFALVTNPPVEEVPAEA